MGGFVGWRWRCDLPNKIWENCHWGNYLHQILTKTEEEVDPIWKTKEQGHSFPNLHPCPISQYSQVNPQNNARSRMFCLPFIKSNNIGFLFQGKSTIGRANMSNWIALDISNFSSRKEKIKRASHEPEDGTSLNVY